MWRLCKLQDLCTAFQNLSKQQQLPELQQEASITAFNAIKRPLTLSLVAPTVASSPTSAGPITVPRGRTTSPALMSDPTALTSSPGPFAACVFNQAHALSCLTAPLMHGMTLHCHDFSPVYQDQVHAQGKPRLMGGRPWRCMLLAGDFAECAQTFTIFTRRCEPESVSSCVFST